MELQREFGLLRTAYFQYLQIRHTAAAQFGLHNTEMQSSQLELLLTDPSHIKLISSYYKTLLHSTTTRLTAIEHKWRSDIPELTEEKWGETLPLQVPSVISSRDKVIQSYYIEHTSHRNYYLNLGDYPILYALDAVWLRVHSST